jgi:hypothetical protein
VDVEVNTLPHSGSDDMWRFRLQNAISRDETEALLAIINVGRNQVALRIRQTRNLMSHGLEKSTTAFPCELSEELAPLKPVPSISCVVDDRLIVTRWEAQEKTIHLLIQQISDGKFLTCQTEWTHRRTEARKFITVLDVLHFAVEHLLAFPVGVLCDFRDEQLDFAIALCSADFSGARQWDSRITEVWQALCRDQDQRLLIRDAQTDQMQAFRGLGCGP